MNMVCLMVRQRWWTNSTREDQLHAQSTQIKPLMITMVEYSMTQLPIPPRLTRWPWLVGVNRMVWNSGEYKTLGVLTGVKKAFSELWGAKIPLPWSRTAIGQLLWRIGQVNTQRLKQSKMIQQTTKLCILCPNPNIQERKIHCSVAVCLLLLLIKKLLQITNLYQLLTYLKTLIGEIWMAETTCLGTRINISLNIVGPAGPKAPQVLWPIDSISWWI